MSNEILWAMDGIDAWEWVRKDTNKVTEQDIKRSQSDASQAKKVQEQIKKQKAENNNIASFLSFLLKNIENEQIISSIYNTFFKVTDNRTKTSYLRKSMNNVVIVWFFAPFFPNELEKFQLKPYFQEFCRLDGSPLNLNEYMEYIKKLSKKYHDNIPINQANLLELLVLIIWNFGIQKEAWNDAEKEKLKKELLKKLK